MRPVIRGLVVGHYQPLADNKCCAQKETALARPNRFSAVVSENTRKAEQSNTEGLFGCSQGICPWKAESRFLSEAAIRGNNRLPAM